MEEHASRFVASEERVLDATGKQARVDARGLGIVLFTGDPVREDELLVEARAIGVGLDRPPREERLRDLGLPGRDRTEARDREDPVVVAQDPVGREEVLDDRVREEVSIRFRTPLEIEDETLAKGRGRTGKVRRWPTKCFT